MSTKEQSLQSREAFEQLRADRPPAVPPHGRGGRRSRWTIAGAVTIAIFAMLASSGGVWLWQHGEVGDREKVAATALSERDQARLEAGTLTTQLERTREKLAAATQAAHEDVAGLRRELRTMLGPPLADGRYFGTLAALGVTQEPPKLVIDVAQWFTGPAADAAAEQDGVLPPGESHVPNDIYIRNEDPRWRMLPIDPSTKVSLVTYPFGQIDAPRVVTLERFGILYSTSDKGSLSLFPYWITVRDGVVVAIEEQYIP